MRLLGMLKSRGNCGSFWRNTSKMAGVHLELHRLMMHLKESGSSVVMKGRMIFFTVEFADDALGGSHNKRLECFFWPE